MARSVLREGNVPLEHSRIVGFSHDLVFPLQLQLLALELHLPKVVLDLLQVLRQAKVLEKIEMKLYFLNRMPGN